MDALEISSQFEELLNEQFMTSKLKKMLETLAKHPKDDKAIIFVGEIQKRFNTILTRFQVNFTALIPSLEHALKSKNIGYTKCTHTHPRSSVVIERLFCFKIRVACRTASARRL